MRCCFYVVLLAAALSAQQQPDAVAGRVVSSVNGAPVPKASVQLVPLPTGGQTPQRAVGYAAESDANGHFSISGVAPGRYEGVPSRTGYGAKAPDQLATSSYFPQITVEPGQRITDVVLRLTPLGVISGRVLDPEGYPISSANVEALQYGYNSGKRILVNRRSVQSDDRGEYRLYHLFPGAYYVRAVKPGNPMLAAANLRGPRPPLTFQPTYFPAALDPADARQVDVAPGGESRATDIRMLRLGLFSIRGHLPDDATPQGRPRVNFMIQKRPRDPGMGGISGWRMAGNTFEVPNLAPGAYVLTARRTDPSAPDQPQVARVFVQITDHDLEGVDLAFTPGMEISGVLRATGSAPVNLENMQVTLQPAEGTGDTYRSEIPVKDGTFTIRNVLPDLYRIELSRMGGYATSVKFGSRELKDRLLDLTRGAGGALSITMSADWARVECKVTGEQGAPAVTANVTLVPDQNQPDWQERFRSQLTEALGVAVFRAVIPGHYTVFAWKDVPRGAPQDPEFRKPFEKLGVPLDAVVAAPKRIELKVIDTQKH